MMTMIVVVIKDNKEKDINCIGWNKKLEAPKLSMYRRVDKCIAAMKWMSWLQASNLNELHKQFGVKKSSYRKIQVSCHVWIILIWKIKIHCLGMIHIQYNSTQNCDEQSSC